jgi:hypothetical protein
MTGSLPKTCERALLEQFMKAESMALWAVRGAQDQNVPKTVLHFLRRHEEEEAQHLQQFEALLGATSRGKPAPPRVPSQWWVLAVHLLGYESLGLEFAKLLVELRPDLRSILEDEEVHVGFFEQEVRRLLNQDATMAGRTRDAALAWRRRLPQTIDRYLHDETLLPFRDILRSRMLAAIDARFAAAGLLSSLPEQHAGGGFSVMANSRG